MNLIFDTNGLFLHFWNSRSVAKSYKRAAARALKSTNTYIVLSRYFIVPLFSRLFADDNFGVRKTSSSSSSSSTLCYSSKQSFSPSLWKKNWLRACYCYRYRAKQGRRKVWKSNGGGKVAFQVWKVFAFIPTKILGGGQLAPCGLGFDGPAKPNACSDRACSRSLLNL